MSDPRPEPSSVALVHRSVPGPSSASPRARQVYRRLLDLSAIGLDVTLVPVETHLPGGAPIQLAAAGVRIEGGPREPASRRIRRLAPMAHTIVLCDLLLPRSVLDAVTDSPATVVLELDHLPSAARVAARSALRPSEAGGLSTEIDHLQTRERAVLSRARLVICNSADTARNVRELLGPHTGTTVTVIAPTAPRPNGPDGNDGTAFGSSSGSSGRLVVPGRFSDEFATPDESAWRSLLLATADRSPALAFSLVAEDTVPRLRYDIKGHVDVVELRDAWLTTCRATAVMDGRGHGLPTTARRAELMAAGVPFVASTAALGSDVLEGHAAELVSDDPAERLRLLLELRDDAALRAGVRADLQCMAAAGEPVLTRDLLSSALAEVGLAVPSRAIGASTTSAERLPRFDAPSDEYVEPRVDGTLAAADPRIEQLEREMIPLRLHTRDTSINLQSTMDPDQRYRVFSRTHLESAPATAPPHSPGADAITFSVLVPTWNSDPGLLAECLDSVLAQAHANWELCIVDDGSTQNEHLQLLQLRAHDDPRIKVRLNPYNQGIALATNDALAMATGDWVVLLDHDDVLKPDALAWVATYADRCPDYDLWYSDEDKLSLDGQLVMPFLKPDWSPDLLMGVNYICHLLSVRRGLIEAVDGFRPGFDGAQDYDLVLRMVERARRVGHIAKPLYSWRMVEGSTALDTGSKPKAHHAGHEALRESLGRRFQPGVVEDGEFDTTHVVRHIVDTSQLLTIMIPTRDRVDLLRACIDRLAEAAGGVRFEILVVDNQSTDPETLAYLDKLIDAGHQVVSYPHDFSFARQINLGVLHARGDLLLILNNDALARNDDWLLRMMEHAQRPEVGLVGAKLMFPDDQRGGRPQHEGIVVGMAGLAYNIDLGGYMGMDQFVRDCSSVTAACVMMRTSVLFAVGGMDEQLRVAYNDVDLGLRTSEMGYRVVYTPHAVLEHPESASRGSLHPEEDEAWLAERWGPKGSVREPFISPQFEWLMPVYYRL